MKIANVALNGVKVHESRLRHWLKDRHPDIITLQKIGPSEDFPAETLREIGYESTLLGKRSRSDLGVAILIRCGLPQPKVIPGAKQQEESRFLIVDIAGLRVSSVYAPFNPKSENRERAIKRRVAWLNRLQDHVKHYGYHNRDSLLCGDFNVKFKSDGPRQGLYSQDEEDALQKLLDLGFRDLYRCAHPDPKENPGHTRGYSKKCPRGTSRLHLILATESLTQRLRSACVDVESKHRPRKDAPPLVVDLDFDV